MKTAKFWGKKNDGRIACELCPHRCVLKEGEVGKCKTRRAEGGALQAMGYGLLSSVHIDPIEKKPLYHFMPGQQIFSIGGWGCNFSCEFCQNWSISQSVAQAGRSCEPERIVDAALEEGTRGIAYTYNEPLINIEFVRDCAESAKEKGLANVLVTNGFIEREPAAFLLPFIDALNIDVKSMEDAFYRARCGGRLRPVLDFATQAKAAGCHLEITNLLISGLNDSVETVGSLSEWIKSQLGEAVPLHLSAYHPDYKMNEPATSSASLERAYERCVQDLRHVYIGNAVTRFGNNTQCPECGNLLIERSGYRARIVGLRGNACAKCGREADIRLA